jgi:hypothetical protein
MASMLPSAKELVERAAQNEAEKAAEAMCLQAKADAEKQALISPANTRFEPQTAHLSERF